MALTSVRRSIAYSLLSSNGVFLLQFVGTLIVARLVTPAEFGIFSVASVVVGLAQILRDLGTGSYIVQAKHLDDDILRTASGLAISSAFVIGVAMWLLSGPIASFYREPSVAQVMQILALNFLMTPFGSVTMACMRREMRFRDLAVANVASAATTLITVCFLTWQGYGARGLAWGAVAGSAMNIAFALFFRPKYLPWGMSFSRWREILGFGSLTTSATIVGHLNMSAVDLLLGKLAGMEAVGLFNRAATLSRFFFSLIMQGLNPVLLPAFSRMRHEGRDLRQPLIDIAVRLCAVAWPAFAVIAVLAEPLVVTLFGDQWLPAAPLVPFLCVTASISAVYSSCSALHTARGKPQINVFLESVNLPIKVAAILVSAPFGLLYVAAAWPLVALCGAMTHQWILIRELSFGFSALYRPLVVNFLIAIACLVTAQATVAGLQFFVLTQAPVLIIGLSVLGASMIWLVGIYASRHPLVHEIERLRLEIVKYYFRVKGK